MIKGWILALSMFIGSGMATAAEPDVHRPVQLVTEEWRDYTNSDGTGLAWDVLRKVFEPAGYGVTTRAEPYSRSVGLVQRGEADAWVGSYQDEKNSLYPRWNYDTDHIYTLGLADMPAPTVQTVGQYHLAWVRSYEYQRYLPNIQHYEEVQRRNGILSMLDHKRADYYIDALTEIQTILEQADDPSEYKVSHLTELPLYIGFSDTPRGRKLRDIFDQRMGQLVESGELKPIFQHWEQPYPFEQTPVSRKR